MAARQTRNIEMKPIDRSALAQASADVLVGHWVQLVATTVATENDSSPTLETKGTKCWRGVGNVR